MLFPQSLANTARERVLDCLERVVGPLPTGLPFDKDYRDPTRMDSLDFVEFVMELEKEFVLDIPDADTDGFRTINDVVRYVLNRSAT